MVAEGFDAGSIFFELRAQVENVQKNVETVKNRLDSLGTGIQNTARKIDVGGAKIQTGFKKATEATNNFNSRLATNVTRLVALQTIITQFTDQIGESEFAKPIRAGGNALVVFATAAATFHIPFGN